MSSSESQPGQPRAVAGFFPPFQMQLPQLVFNGFATTHSASEVTALISFADRQLALLVMPPVVAKSFALSILETVEHYEKSGGVKIDTLEELTARMAKYDSGQTS